MPSANAPSATSSGTPRWSTRRRGGAEASARLPREGWFQATLTEDLPPLRSTVIPPMTAIDWIIVVFTLAMAVWGYAQGLIVGALSLAGFGAGAFLGSRIGPLLLEEGSKSPYAPLTALMGALVIGGILASVLEVV